MQEVQTVGGETRSRGGGGLAAEEGKEGQKRSGRERLSKENTKAVGAGPSLPAVVPQHRCCAESSVLEIPPFGPVVLASRYKVLPPAWCVVRQTHGRALACQGNAGWRAPCLCAFQGDFK